MLYFFIIIHHLLSCELDIMRGKNLMGKIIDQWIVEMNKQGITNAHIESMKYRTLKSYLEYSLVYDMTGIDMSVRKPSLVDVIKIGGINTVWHTANRSVYELFFSVTGELPIKGESLHSNRIQDNLNSLVRYGLSYQHHFYVDSTKEPLLRDGLPEFDYYLDDDIYFSGATHRTVSAIMFNAPQMVGYVKTYRKNKIKVHNYSKHKQSKKKWSHFLSMELNTLIIKNVDIKSQVSCDFYVYLKEYPKELLFTIENPVLIATNDNLIQTYAFEAEEAKVNALIDKLREVDNSLTSVKLNSLPWPLRMVRKVRILYLAFALFYDKPNKYIDIIKDSSNDIVEKIKRRSKNRIIYKHTLEIKDDFRQKS